MSSGITSALLFLPCILWSEVSAQCSDPLIYKLNDIHQLIANCSAQISSLTAKQDKQEAEIQNYKEQLQKQVRQLWKAVQGIHITTPF